GRLVERRNACRARNGDIPKRAVRRNGGGEANQPLLAVAQGKGRVVDGFVQLGLGMAHPFLDRGRSGGFHRSCGGGQHGADRQGEGGEGADGLLKIEGRVQGHGVSPSELGGVLGVLCLRRVGVLVMYNTIREIQAESLKGSPKRSLSSIS